MQEEQDTCRICSAPAEPDQPLFHPCKCSGTIRYIHQDCLTTWLTHSKKQHCDVCKHPYSFTKVYASDMPKRLPILLVFRKLVQQFFSILLFTIRAVLVACIWLAVLPWITLWTWRAYFAVGDVTAFWIADVPRPPVPHETGEPSPVLNATLLSNLSDPNASLVSVISSHPVWKSLAADIFLGQIIASLIVLTFVAVFLLREWVSQNARPGVFEDADVPPQADDPPPEPNADQPQERQPGEPAPLPIGPRPETPPPPAEPIPPPAFIPEPQRRRVIHRRALKRGAHEVRPNGTLDRAKKKGDILDEEGSPRHSVRFRKRLSPIGSSSDSDEEDPKSEEISSRIYSDSNATLREAHEEAMKRREVVSPVEIPSLSTDREETKFTFTATLPPESRTWNELSSMSSLDVPLQDLDHPPPSPISIPPASTFSRRPTPNDTTPPRPSSLPSTPKYKFDSPGSQSQESFFPSTNPPSTRPTTTPPLPYPLFPRRPSMPSTTIPSPQAIALSSPGAGPSNGKRRLGSAPASPSLASYIAPEELEVSSTKLYRDYFDLPVDVEEGPSSIGSGGVDKETNRDEYEGMKELPKDERGDYVEDDESDTDLSDLDEGTSIAGLFGLPARQTEPNGIPERPEPIPEGPARVDGEPEDDFDPRDFPTYFSDGTLDVVEERDRNSDNVVFSDSDDEDDDAQDLGHLEHILRDGAPVGLRIREVRPGAVENLMAAAGGIGQQNGAGNGVVNPPVNDQADPVPPVQEVNEEIEPNLDDDMEGAMEAIGLRGPVLTVLQNAALMVLILDTTIGFSILLPFTLGKSTALLVLNPRRTLQLVHMPIRGIRFITDPIVDMVGLALQIILFGPLLRACQKFADVRFFRSILGEDRIKDVTGALTSTYQHGLDLATIAQGRFGDLISAFESGGTTSQTPSTSFLDKGFDSALGQLIEPYFASFGQEVRNTAEGVTDWWVRMSLGRGPVEKAFAIVYGYLLIGISLAIYMNVLTVGTIKTAEKAVRTVIRQQLLVVKVATFIIIELIIFPLGCGVILDLCTIWFFPEVCLKARLVFVQYAPLTATFYHWVVGTMFMYMFAILLGGCRQIMRSGAMWFIKDPQNQNMHPIRDILERPTFTHLYKLFQSAIMYALVVVCGVGNVSLVVQTLTPSLLPFRWKPREPLSTVPYDLVFMHLILPYTIHYFRPRTAARQLGTVLWKWLSRNLRVSSYMFGDRHPDEEVASKGSFPFWSKNVAESDSQKPQSDGGWRRVPANDNVAIVRGMRATVEVTEDGEPINEVEARLLKLQNAEAERHKRNVDEDYAVVYIPPYFKWRIVVFIIAVWSVCCIAIAAMLAGPVLLGRRFFLLFTTREVHDGYSFVIGFHLLWGCWLVAQAVERLDRHRQRRENGSRAWWPLFLAKRSSLWFAQVSYMAFFLVFVIPTFIALVMEMYVLLPIKFTYDPQAVVKVKLVEMWVLGLFYTKIILRLPGFEAPRRMNEGIQRINRNGWSRPDPMTATKEVIGPAVGGLMMMLAFPVALLWVLKTITKYPSTDRTLFTSIYPGIFVGVGIVRAIWMLHRMYMKWSQTVRDKEFLVEMRLRNLEPGETKGKAVQTRDGEDEDEQEQGEAAVRDLPVLDLIENQSDGESDNEDERFLL